MILMSVPALISDKFNSYSNPQSLINSSLNSGAISKDFTTLKLLNCAKDAYAFNCLETELNLLYPLSLTVLHSTRIKTIEGAKEYLRFTNYDLRLNCRL